MHRALFLTVALGFVLGSASWLVTARRMNERAEALRHRGLRSGPWGGLAIKEALIGALFVVMAVAMTAEGLQGETSWADPFLGLVAVPLALSLVYTQRFWKSLRAMETQSETAQRAGELAAQERALAGAIGGRLAEPHFQAASGIEVRTLYRPAEGALGGDFLGIVDDGEGVTFFIGDVTGHGLDAALQALRIKDLLTSSLATGGGALDATKLVNGFLCTNKLGESFATIFIATCTAGLLTYVNAGHPPALIVKEDERIELWPTGPLLGVAGDSLFKQKTQRVPADALLVAFTDGLLEVHGARGGIEIADVARAASAGGLQGVGDFAEAERRGPLRDDIAVIEISFAARSSALEES